MPLKTSKKNKVAYLHFYAFYVHKKDSIFMRLKTSKEKKVASLTFCAFCAFFCVKSLIPSSFILLLHSDSVLGHLTFRLNYHNEFLYQSIFLWTYSKVSHRLLFFCHFGCAVCIIYFRLSIIFLFFQSPIEGPYHQQLLVCLEQSYK